MASVLLATVRLFAASGVMADDALMDFVFQTDDSGDPPIEIDGFIVGFFTTIQVIPGDDHKVTDHIGDAWLASGTGTNVEIAVYDITAHLDGSPHGSPIAMFGHDWSHSGWNSLPTEVGLKVSARANYGGVPEISGSTRPRARRRGGVFVPWIVAGAGSGGGGTTGDTPSQTFTGGQSRPSQNLIDTFRAAGVLLAGESEPDWSIWSRVDAAARSVDIVSVDNAWDTIRKRGCAPTARFTGAP